MTEATAKSENLPAAPAIPRRELIVSDNSSFANLFDTGRFEQMQRVAKLFAASQLVPKMYQDQPANCFVAIQMATRLEIDPFMFMQNTYTSPDGKPALYGQLAIALINARGPFRGPVQFEFSGEGDNYGCEAWGDDRQTGKRCGVRVTVAMAKAEGWYSRNKKWQSITDVMLRYRSGAWLGRAYCPEVLMGLPVEGEPEDVTRLEQRPDGSYSPPPRPTRAEFRDLSAEEQAKVNAMAEDARIEHEQKQTPEPVTVQPQAQQQPAQPVQAAAAPAPAPAPQTAPEPPQQQEQPAQPEGSIPVAALIGGVKASRDQAELDAFWRDCEEARSMLEPGDRADLNLAKAEVERDLRQAAKGRR